MWKPSLTRGSNYNFMDKRPLASCPAENRRSQLPIGERHVNVERGPWDQIPDEVAGGFAGGMIRGYWDGGRAKVPVPDLPTGVLIRTLAGRVRSVTE